MDGDTGSWEGPSKDWIIAREKILGKVKTMNVCVQAGGNLGMYPRMLATRFKTLYTFEPDPLNFACLVKNVTTDNVIKLNAGLGSQNELVGMNILAVSNLGMNQTVQGAAGGYIPMFTIDQLALKECNLIWLDIEKREDQAIYGAEQTIMKFHPVIALETATPEIVRWLEERGYTLTDRCCDSVFEYVRAR